MPYGVSLERADSGSWALVKNITSPGPEARRRLSCGHAVWTRPVREWWCAADRPIGQPHTSRPWPPASGTSRSGRKPVALAADVVRAVRQGARRETKSRHRPAHAHRPRGRPRTSPTATDDHTARSSGNSTGPRNATCSASRPSSPSPGRPISSPRRRPIADLSARSRARSRRAAQRIPRVSRAAARRPGTRRT